MDIKQREEFIQLINQGIQEVVIPAMEGVESELKKEIKSLRGEINKKFEEVNDKFTQVNDKFDEVNDKLDRLDRRDDRVADEQVDFRARLRRVESAVFKKVD